MNTQRLEQHYQKLIDKFPQREVLITLQELADLLFCSKRHMRTLIVHMQQAGWLSWKSQPGRGHKAQLTLHSSSQMLMMAKAERLLNRNDMNGALAILGEDRQHLTQLLRNRMGHSIEGDRQSLRIPYYRSLHNLYPGFPLRRSETHLVKQIFSGLTCIDENTGEISQGLAHHWRKLNPLRWCFYLRPGVLFHDGTPLTSKDVVVSLQRSARLPLFSHFQRIAAQGNLSVIIELAYPDENLPLLLSDTGALILPADHHQRSNFALKPVGTGPYRVTENNDWHLILTAFDRYFGLRSLLDEIEVITCIDNANQEEIDRPFALLSSSMSDLDYIAARGEQFSAPPAHPVLEKGGYFLLYDSRSPQLKTIDRRRWLQHILTPEQILKHMPSAIRSLWSPATSLRPDWFHSILPGPTNSPWPQNSPNQQMRLRLAYHQHHWELPILVEACRHILKVHNISLEAIALPYDAWAKGEGDADIWLGTVNFNLPEQWNIGAWLLGMPLLKTSISGGCQQRFADWQQQWRSDRLSSQQLTANIIHEGWLQPLFHHWMHLTGSQQAQGIHFNNLGWFDFTSIWIEPPEID